jgi:serine/threonine protein kinase
MRNKNTTTRKYNKGDNNTRKSKSLVVKNKTRSRLGGEALGSGGFGCVFKPALKCKDKQHRTTGISKMSIEKYSKQEMYEITKIKNKLHKIKNYEQYFLLDVDRCSPDKLSPDDMKQFNKKCFSLTKENLNENNINKNLHKVSILNMPDGGIDLKDWLVHDGKITRDKMFLLNHAIIRLLEKGVRPMNEAGVIHNDLKDRNILIDKHANARIIDWGLSGVVVNNTIPVEIRNRPLQFNTPFSSMILSDEFKLNYDAFLTKVKNEEVLFNTMNVRNYVVNEYLIKLARYYGYYDDNVILFKTIFNPAISEETFLSEVKRDNLIEYGYYLYYLSNYITDILMKYTNDKLEFEVDKYFMECYLFNSDIFGLITIYYNYFDSNVKFVDFDEAKKNIYLNRVRSMLVEHIYSNGAHKINIHKLVKSLHDLNKIVNYDNTLSISSGKKALYSIFSSNDISSYSRSRFSDTLSKKNQLMDVVKPTTSSKTRSKSSKATRVSKTRSKSRSKSSKATRVSKTRS